jgi:pyruvate dehydrogenase E2 component (dihydrolipoamide acetyltransferase)
MATQVLVPLLGQTVDTVTLVAWYKEEGESITQGEMLFAIETDKATLDIEAPASGVLRQVTAQPGDEVQVLGVIGVIIAPGEVVESRQVDKEQGRERVFVSPRARRLAKAEGVPLAALKPSGPEGAIVERDVRGYLTAQAAPAITPVARHVAEEAEPGDDRVLETIPVRGVRALIAERMAHSATTTARVTFNAEADATALVELRRRLNEDGVSVSYNALFLHVLGRALRDHPRLNASLAGDTIHVWKQIHIGLAVDTERGLLVPVVRDVDCKGLRQLAEEAQALAERARAGQCPPEELSSGTFTLTNLGMFGIDSFTPIINLPECAILGVGRIKTQPAFVGDQVVARQMVWFSLTFDHRLVDGAPAARFMQRVVQLIEHPHLLLV